jgi:hypothetical protein
MTKVLSTSTIVIVALLAAGCSSISLPTLENPSCTQARESARSFYSLHFGSDLKPSEESIEARSIGLTARFAAKLRAERPEAVDPFTLTEDYPRAFKLGACKRQNDGSVVLEVQLLWRDKEMTKQESVDALMVGKDGKWLIDGISVRK